MGLDRAVQFPAGNLPAWDAIKSQLLRVGEPGTLRMINGEPAFPDEVPEGDWRELRIAAGGSMVTVRRTGDSLSCIVWGNAGADLVAARDRVAWACAAAGGGSVVVTDGATVSAAEFAQLSDIRPA